MTDEFYSDVYDVLDSFVAISKQDFIYQCSGNVPVSLFLILYHPLLNTVTKTNASVKPSLINQLNDKLAEVKLKHQHHDSRNN